MKYAALILTLVGMLVALTLDYGKTRENAALAVQQAEQIQRLRVNQERLQVWVSHAQSWKDARAMPSTGARR